MKKLTWTIFFSAAALQLAGAADAPSTNTPASAPAAPVEAGEAASEPESAPKIQLKNTSSFTMEENSRNPFWPIGWKPTPKQHTSVTEAATPDLSANAFRVTSITLGGGTRFAIINGKPMTEGQVFGLQMGTQTYQLTVKSIEDGRVILLRRDQEIEVPLYRR